MIHITHQGDASSSLPILEQQGGVVAGCKECCSQSAIGYRPAGTRRARLVRLLGDRLKAVIKGRGSSPDGASWEEMVAASSGDH